MYWQLEKYLVDEFIKIIRRIFKNQTTWVNTGKDAIQFSSGAVALVFEQFFEENEKYPIITVYSAGGVYANDSLSDYVSTLSGKYYSQVMGVRALAYETISNIDTLAVQLPDSLAAKQDQISGIYLDFVWNGRGIGGDDIKYNLYSNYTTSPNLVASGSIAGNLLHKISRTYSLFDPIITLSGSDYWITFNSTEKSVYAIMLDNTKETLYKKNSGSPVSGSIVGGLMYPPLHKIGGRFESSITIRVMCKNNTALARNLGEIIITRLLLLKTAQYDRSSQIEQSLSTFADGDIISEWESKGIAIKGVKTGVLEMRRRGINDIIFTLPISIDLLTHWSVDYPGEFLKNFNIDVTPFGVIDISFFT